MNEDLHHKLEKLGYTKVVTITNELEKAVQHIEDLKVGFSFDNSRAISVLHKIVQEA